MTLRARRRKDTYSSAVQIQQKLDTVDINQLPEFHQRVNCDNHI